MISLLFLVLALVCFLLAAGSFFPRVNLLALGLALLTLSFILAGAHVAY